MTGIEIVLGTSCPNDCIDTLRQSVDFLDLGTPVRVRLAESPGDMFGKIVGVRLDTGRRGRMRGRKYVPDKRDERGHRARDIPPNVVNYVVRDDVTDLEFECAPRSVSARNPTLRPGTSGPPIVVLDCDTDAGP